MLKSFQVAVLRCALAFLLAAILSIPAHSADSSLANLETGLSNLIYGLSQSLVTIESYSHVEMSGVTRSIVSSGIIIDSSGHIIVAAKPILGAEKIFVIYANRRLPAKLIGIDYREMIALLHIKEPVGFPAEFSEFHSCAGQMVVAMGSAYGLRVSPSIGFCAGARDDGCLQFSVPVASGTVGGGVFNLSGQVLGVIVDGIGQFNQVTLAVPAYRIDDAINYLKSSGNRYVGYLGVKTRESLIDPPIRTTIPAIFASAQNNHNDMVSVGLQVTAVFPGSPSMIAGVHPGDIIHAIGNRPLETSTELATLVKQLEPGMTINLEIIRRGHPISLPLVVGKKSIRQMKLGYDGTGSNFHPAKTIDSLASVLQYFREEVIRLERKLQSID